MKRWALLGLVFLVACRAEEAGQGEEGEEGEEGKSQREIVGQYSYCAEDNCYELLGVTKESGPIPIKRAYRRLATEWHPDKNPHPDAKKIFQKYANAYEVLSNPKMRKNYNYLLEHPYEFPMHFLLFSKAKYAPKSDVRFVVILILLGISAVQYLFQMQRYNNVLTQIKASPKYQEQLKTLMSDKAKSNSKGGSSKRKESGTKSDEYESKKAAAEEQLLPEIEALLPPAPTCRNSLGFQLFTLPLTSYQGVLFSISWFLRFRILGQHMGPEEHGLLTRLALGISELEWGRTPAAERADFLAKELWISANLKAFREEQEAAMRASTSSAQRTAKEKRMARLKKKGLDAGPLTRD